MTTQELKEYIGRVLGNSIRCLLPSYWWKRLFGLVVDKVEEVEGSIVSSLDEFAKERPDIEMRTFYLSEDAELVAHNVQVFQTLMRDAIKRKIRPYYIATTIDEDQQVWFIRNESFYPSGVGALPTFIIEEDSKKYVVLFFADGAYIKQETEIEDDSVTVDTEMSSTSENAVQNKVIKAYVDKSIEDYDQSISEAILGELDKKVDKVEGKQLSTEDFTTALKTKLEGMSSFDPTEINNKVDGLQSQINTLVSGDASTAIESFNEIIAFLNGVQDTESLDGIIAGIEQQIAAKQDEITDLETIRSGAALGATALQEHQDISHLATKDEVTNLINEMVANEEVHAAAYTDLDSRLKDIGSLISGVAVTKEEFQEGLQNITNEVVANEEVTAAALNDLNERINAISENVSGETATKVELEEVVESINAIIIDNEEVHAAALNELNARINDMALRLKALENVNN